ncbi:hypothetical protein LB534_26675 [Mesorhizobium sp. CA18]|uniref:hypothetical protein n=1 Tax=unclassified Mesorhizobium TaxID=325217 RepID=UPI001CC9FA97|nr:MULTISPECIES: hypothetical protein [unclassified Mesorhizobium]MBZ9735029.1 hypothetical protein [Mesorhizobium sp. CA9]MBZ9828880.1 hypothetical protein [Mesorhizobium sp. CA18]MBZ9834305.1 hypothetical protein [Mesorhizobium sp. CA2]MBZ9838895.1 hypothetical protein [Mesorhizobium sp. CA3]MBZ9880107.1 hypothetical protein [Mesorhizobium sp. Ca11]
MDQVLMQHMSGPGDISTGETVHIISFRRRRRYRLRDAFLSAHRRPLERGDLAEGRLKPRPPMPQWRDARVSSPGLSPFLAQPRNARLAILRFAAVASDAAAVAFGLTIAIEAAWCGLGNENGD